MGFGKEKHEVQKFRHRGFELVDGSGVAVPGVDTVMMFGNDPAPSDPVSSDSHWVKRWDNDVEQHIIVTKHIETADAGTVADPAAH